jgi:hypothetical protein
MDEKRTTDGRNWISCDVFVVGDYGGAGSVGAANIKTLISDNEKTYEQISMSDWERGDELTRDSVSGHSVWTPVCPDDSTTLVITYGNYSSQQAWLLDTPHNREIINSLSDYPVIDDEEIGFVEMEWETEAWESWVRSDLIRAVGKVDSDLQDIACDMEDSDLFEAYRAAMEETNTYPTAEYNGVHIDVDRISDAFCQNIIDMLGQ